MESKAFNILHGMYVWKGWWPVFVFRGEDSIGLEYRVDDRVLTFDLMNGDVIVEVKVPGAILFGKEYAGGISKEHLIQVLKRWV